MTFVHYFRQHPTLLVVVGFLILVNLVFLVTSPRAIVDTIGVENSYLITFLVAAVGGVSTVTGGVLYATVITFAAGGAPPYLLGLVGGVGIFLSNSVFFWLARSGRESLPPEWEARVCQVAAWITRRVPHRWRLVAAYVYLGISPLADDLLMLALVVIGYTYRQVWPVLLAGGISFATLTAYVGNVWDALALSS